MKKIVFIGIALIMSVLLGYSQKTDEFAKLKKLYNEGKFENCLNKSEKYMYNDKTKREPIPYLYCSMSYFELSHSDDPDIQDYYPKALNNALKYAVKFNQKDKKNRYEQKSSDYINQLTTECIADVQEQFNDGKYRKSASVLKQLVKLTADDNLLFAEGVCNVRAKNYSGAKDCLTKAVIQKNEKKKSGDLKPNKIVDKLFIDYSIDYAEYLVNNQMPDSALSTISFALKFHPDNSTLKKQKLKTEAIIKDKIK